MDNDSELLFPREKTGRDHNVRNMNDHGKVIEQIVDETQVSVVCQILDKDGMVTKPLPVKQFGSRSTGAFWCPKIGDDVSITFYPNSETGDGCVDGTFYNTSNPPPITDPNRRHLETEKGDVFDFDETTQTLLVSPKGPINIQTDGPITMTAPMLNVVGDVNIVGILTLDGVVINDHVHSGVTTGANDTQGPKNP